jgi:DNA-binding XRE family transcriptional regulator
LPIISLLCAKVKSERVESMANLSNGFSYEGVQEMVKGLIMAGKCERPRIGWLKLYRRSHKLTAGELAKRMGVTRHVPLRFEKAEARDAITLRSLRKMACAMDMELVYGLIPKAKPETKAK